MKRTLLSLSILILLTSISIACEKTTVSAIVADSQKFDHKEVCIEALVSNPEFKISKKGNAYTSFWLHDEKGNVLTVFFLGTLSIKEGDKVKVTGRNDVVKRLKRFNYNEIVASSV